MPDDDISTGESLTVAEAAEKLNCSERTIYRLIQKRSIPFVKLGYRTIRLPARAVDEFITSGGLTPKIRQGHTEWLDRVYKPMELPVAHAKLTEHIRRAGEEIIDCVLEFKTAHGRTYRAKIHFPGRVP